jgi:hypothetical protein
LVTGNHNYYKRILGSPIYYLYLHHLYGLK